MFCFVVLFLGGEVEAGGAYAEREADPASHRLPLPRQSRISFQGKIARRPIRISKKFIQ